MTEEKGYTNLRQSIQDKDLIWEVEMISSVNAMLSHRCLLEVWVEMLGKKLTMSMELKEISTLVIQVLESFIQRLELNL